MNDNPLISILIPAYNVGSYLPQCLDSVIHQTYTNLQIVVIDDGSKDNTLEICEDYSKRDIRIEIYHHENSGVAVTRNSLLDKIKGDYVLFVDGDDWIELNMVDFLVKQVHRGNFGIVTCSMVKNESSIRNDFSSSVWDKDKTVCEFLKHILINGSLCNKIIRSDLIQNERFNPSISYGEDALFLWHVIQKNDITLYTDRQLYHYRMNEQSISHLNYDSKKMSGHIVWQQIVEETVSLWPQYSDIAIANYAISDMWQLYFAAQCNYRKDEKISEFQKNIRKHLFTIYKTKLINKKKMIFATIAAYCYKACKWFV